MNQPIIMMAPPLFWSTPFTINLRGSRLSLLSAVFGSNFSVREFLSHYILVFEMHAAGQAGARPKPIKNAFIDDEHLFLPAFR